MNNNPNFELQKIPSNITILKNFSQWRYVGKDLDAALFIGLLEYHIGVNKVGEFFEQIKSQTLNPYFERVKTTLKNGEKKKSQIEYFLYEIWIQDKSFQWLRDIMKNFFQLKGIKNQNDKEKKLVEVFKVNLQINEKVQRISIYQNNFKAPVLIFYLLDQSFYFINPLYQNKNCQLCGQTQNVAELKCKHFMCFDCLSQHFSKQQTSAISCKCNQMIDKTFFLNLQQPRNIEKDKNIKNPDEQKKNIKSENQEQKQVNNQLQNQTQNKQGQSEIVQHQIKSQNQQQQQYKNKENKEDQQSKEYQYFSEQQIPKETQQEEQQSQITVNENKSSNVLQIDSDKFQSEREEKKQQNQQQQQKLFCTKCDETYVVDMNNKQQTCAKCSEKSKLQTKSIDENNNNFQQKQNSTSEKNLCCKCQKRKKEKFYHNRCGHIFCVDCLEQMAQQCQKIYCCICRSRMKEEDVENFYFQFQQDLIQIQEQESIKIDEQQQNEINYSNNNLYEKKLKQQENTHCSFCFSPFTQYNIQQSLNFCQNQDYHYIGTCCIIFPLECPQCQINSLRIQKSKLSFQIENEIFKDLQSKLYQ